MTLRTGSLERGTTAPPTTSEHDAVWYNLTTDQALAKLDSSLEGLAEAQVRERQAHFGANSLPRGKQVSLIEIILHQFLSPLIYILLIAGVISLVTGHHEDAIFIFVVILLNASLGAFQEWRAEKSAAALQSLLKIITTVRRDGVDVEEDAEALVPGDIVLLESGGNVPADLRLLRAKNLTVDESFLTGESVALEKNPGVLHGGSDTPIGDRLNMLYAGSTVMTGRGTGLVVATGRQTEIGQIAGATTEKAAAVPPLVIRMERFVKHISYIVLGSVFLLGAISMAQGTPFEVIFFLAVALAVSAIPEGLPFGITVALAIAVNRMARSNVIVRRMTAVEGLGSCTYVASDKTGTLTVNRLTAKRVILPGRDLFFVSGEGYSGEGEVSTLGGERPGPTATEHLLRLARASMINNEGGLARRGDEWKHRGDAVDVALLALGYKMGLPLEKALDGVHIVAEIPFESERRYAASVYQTCDKSTVAVKGAAETIIRFCDYWLTEKGEEIIDRYAVEAEALELSQNGYRVIAVAEGTLPRDLELDEFNEAMLPPLTLLGLVGFIDPLRPEAKESVERCKQAGVQVAMVTGDHPATALAIARELGIASTTDDIVTGTDLLDAGEPGSQRFAERVLSAHVFARVSPLQKLQIVEALTSRGHFVAVTGDGVNDAPALHAANIGVAMGSGTDIAKDTASIIVTDDNFASIVKGIEEGRHAYSNIRKVIYLLISTGAAEIVLFMLAIISRMPLPLLAVQILWLNLVTNGIQDKALAFEGGEPGIMKRPPRDPEEGIFNRMMIQQVVVSGLTMGVVAFSAWLYLLNAGWAEESARNLVLLLMVLFQNFHIFNCRSERVSAFRLPLSRNYLVVVAMLAAFGLHMWAMHLPLFQRILNVNPVTFQEFAYLVVVASTILVAMEVFKAIKRRVA
jgi:magnesium-transporting ATPase (P-type)